MGTKEIPVDLRYTVEHEWLRTLGETIEIGITAFAADQLGDVVFVELPEVGTLITAGTPFGVVESVKSVSDLFAPLSGTVTEVNETLQEAPERVNEACYGEGWMIRIKPDADQDVKSLLSAQEYAKTLV
ncbi:MAG: glycine cleavage system protein GcvH [Magnetococcales bacterium]|nr:glycine cleavage system protein GcvH [Magnetococcales bacterium]